MYLFMLLIIYYETIFYFYNIVCAVTNSHPPISSFTLLPRGWLGGCGHPYKETQSGSEKVIFICFVKQTVKFNGFVFPLHAPLSTQFV